MANKCYLYSKVNYPVEVMYGEQKIIISPNARQILFEDYNKFDIKQLPKEIVRKEIKGTK